MALLSDYTFSNGLVAKKAYIRVADPVVRKVDGEWRVHFGVAFLQNAESGEELQPQQLFSAPYNLDGANPLAQAYGHLATLKQFENAKAV